jgi:ketosteroid isomerase-like protein
MIRALLVPCALLVATSLAAHAAPSDLANMVQAEYDFAALAKREGYKTSFLKYLSEDSVMFENGAVPARARVSARPEMQGSLRWYPSNAVVSSAGDIGLSTGPWVYWNQGKPQAYGHFVSIWRKQADGSWRNALDVGVNHDELKPAPGPLKLAAPTGHADSTNTTARTDRASDIRAAEAQFAQLATTSGYSAATGQLASSDVRVYRDGHPPMTGTAEAASLLKERDATGTPRLDYAAGSGDFGYSYGLIGKSQFVHVWQQRNGKWQLLTDVLLPLPEPKPK